MRKKEAQFKPFSSRYGSTRQTRHGRSSGSRGVITEPFLAIAYYMGTAVFGVCYAVGWCVYAPIKFSHTAKARIAQAVRQPHTITALLIFLILIVFSLGSMNLAQSFVNKGLNIKGQVLGTTEQGIASLSEAQTLLESQDTAGATRKFSEALAHFSQAQDELQKIGAVVNTLLNTVPQKRDAENLLSSVTATSAAGLELSKFYATVKALKVTPQGISGSHSTKDSFDALSQYLHDAQFDLNLANQKISNVDSAVVPVDKRAAFLQAKEALQLSQGTMEAFGELFDFTKQIVLGHKHVLMVFENNNELRATGGFMGTFGGFDLNDGVIERMKISSIYDLDGQLADKITPPHPLYMVNTRWFMRDSNWFSNFPDSAQTISGFYEKEGGKTPDMVIAATPDLIQDLLTVTGPISMDRYHVTLTADNFVETTQIATSINYDKNLNEPKQLLADFYPTLLQRLGDMQSDHGIELLQALQRNLASKQIILYSRDPGLEQTIRSFGWSGELLSTDRDYLSIVSSNLGGTKTDLYQQQDAALTSEVGEGGTITNTLVIHKKNPLTGGDLLKNSSYLRIYVPQGSKLISASGFTPTTLDDPSQHPVVDAKTDPKVAEWEKGAVKDLGSDTLIGTEAGNTFFGNWLTLSPGQSATVTLIYTLPFKATGGVYRHSLLVQKQAGAVRSAFTYNFKMPHSSLLWKNNTAEETSDGISARLTLDKDYFVGAVFKDDNVQ